MALPGQVQAFLHAFHANFPSCCLSAMTSSHLGLRSWRKTRGSVTGPRSWSSAGRGGQDTDAPRGGVPLSPAKGLSLRRGDQPQVRSSTCKNEARVWSTSRTEQAHQQWDGCSLPPFGLAGRMAQGRPQALGMFGLSFVLQAVAACQDSWVWRSDNSRFKPPELLQGLKWSLT